MYRKIILVIVMCFSLLSHMPVKALDENAAITRAELANAVMETYEYITQEFSLPTEERPTFSDIGQTPFQIRILQAHVNGFMNGVGDERFLPNENATKCQAAAVLYRLMQCLNEKYGLLLEEKQVTVSDLEAVPEWGTEAVNYMASTGLMQLREGKFHPDELVTKEELNATTEKIKEIFVISDDGERIDFQTFLDRMMNMNK